MFDIGQNDLAGPFYSKSLDQILALIPTILVEFENGFKVHFHPDDSMFIVLLTSHTPVS